MDKLASRNAHRTVGCSIHRVEQTENQLKYLRPRTAPQSIHRSLLGDPDCLRSLIFDRASCEFRTDSTEQPHDFPCHAYNADGDYNALMNTPRIICRQQLGDLLLHQPATEFLSSSREDDALVLTRTSHSALVELMPGVSLGTSPMSTGCEESFCFDAKLSSILLSLNVKRRNRTLLIPAKKINALHRSLFGNIIDSSKGNRYTALALFTAVGGRSADFRPPRLRPPPEDWHLPNIPERYFLLHPTSAWQRKCLAPQRWVSVLANTGVRVPIILTSGGTDWEEETCNTIENGLLDKGLDVRNLSGKTSLNNYLALLSRSMLTLCVDGSSSHISSAFSRPTFTLFGPTNPVHWHWPTPASVRLWARDFSSERHPSTNSIPEDAIIRALSSFLSDNAL